MILTRAMRRVAVHFHIASNASTPPARAANALLAALSLVLALALGSCGSVRTDGLVDGSSGGMVRTDARAPAPAADAGTMSYPLPGSGAKSLAVWTCSGGASVSSEKTQVGVSVGGVSGVGTVASSGGAQVTLGHFNDTVE